MLILRSAIFNVLFYLMLIALLIVGLPTLAFGRHAVLRLAQVWSRMSIALLDAVCGTRVEVRGLDHLPPQPCVIAAKHQSFLEIMVFASLFTDYTFVLKRELTRIPLFGWYLAASGQVAIDRAQGRSALAQAIRLAKVALLEGRHFFIFPEGTRRPPGAPAAYKIGAAAIAVEAGVDCVPVAVNTGLFWPRRSFLRRPGAAIVAFLPPIAPGLDRVGLHALLRDRIETASDALAAEAFEADPRLAPMASGAAAPAG